VHESNDAFDLIILIMLLAVFTPFMVYYSIPFFKGEVGGFNVQIEKTAFETAREIYNKPAEMKTNDALLMLVIADEFAPEPRKLKFNGGTSSLEVPIDDVFLLNRTAYILGAKEVMPYNREIDLQLYIGPSGMRYWNVKEQP